MICLARMRRDRRTQEYVARRTAGEAWQEQAGDHPLPQALRRQGGIPRADLLRLPYLADRSKRGSPDRRPETTPLDHRSVARVNETFRCRSLSPRLGDCPSTDTIYRVSILD
jgi:hypothetical protein